MSELSANEINHLAQLARISLSEEEKERFSKELPKIVEFVEQLQGVSTFEKGWERPTGGILLEDLRTDDEVGVNTLSISQLEKLAPAWRDNQNEVPAVFSNTDEGGDA